MSGSEWGCLLPMLLVLYAGCAKTLDSPSTPPSDQDATLPLAPEMPGARAGQALRPEEGGFEVMLPLGAEPPARSVEGDNHLSYESETASATFTVEVIHVPGGIANPEQFLARMRSRVVETGTVLDESEGGPGGHMGWSMRLTGVAPREQEHVRVDLAVTERRAFLLMVTTDDPAAVEAPETAQFFTSFRSLATTGLSRRVRSIEGSFEFEFPEACGPAFKRVEMVDHKIHIAYVSEGSGVTQCMASVARVDPVPTDQVLDAAVDGATRSIPGAVVDGTEDSMIAGAPRRTVRLHATLDGVALHMRADFIYVDRALHQLQVVSADPADLESAQTLAFFASFRTAGR